MVAISEGVPILKTDYWKNATDLEWRHVFRSDNDVICPMLEERIRVVRYAADCLIQVRFKEL
jgi:hypothetical protein